MKFKSFFSTYSVVLCADLFLSTAYADNCGTLSDCWNTLTAAAITAAAAAAAAALAAGLAFKEKGQKVGDFWADKIEDLREWYENYVAQYMDKKAGHTLTDQEHRFGAWNPLDTRKIAENANIAEKSTIENFSDLMPGKELTKENLRNTPADAFRHFVWSALNARDIGIDDARKYAIAHEMYKENFEKTYNEFAMDTWNNVQGLNFGSSPSKPSLEDIVNEGKKRVKDETLGWFGNQKWKTRI